MSKEGVQQPKIMASFVINKIKEFNSDSNFTKEEMSKIDKMYDKISTKEGKEKVKNHIKEKIKGETKTKLLNLIENNTPNNLKGGFSEIKENVDENNEAMKDFMDTIGEYIDFQLDPSFTAPQKDKIKLVLTYNLINKIDIADPKSLVFKGLFGKIKDGIESLTKKYLGKKEINSTDKTKINDDFSLIFEQLGLKQFGKEFNQDIEKINKAKSKPNTFSKLGEIGKIISVKDNKLFKGKSENQIKKNIKTKVKNFGEKLKGYRGAGKDFLNNLDNQEILGFNLGEGFRDFVSKKIKEGGLIGAIVGFIAKLFFGSDFLDNVDNKKRKATENLKKSIKKSEKGIFKTFKEKNVENLKGKDLEKFYKFLDSKKIDYSKSDFWDKLTTGKVDGELLKIYNILTDNGKIKGILSGEELKGNKVENFAKKLNGIPDIFKKKEAEDNSKKIDKNNKRIAELKAKQNKAKKTEPKVKKDTTTVVDDKVVKKAGLTKTEQKELDKLNKETNKLKFEQSISNLKIPGEIINPKTGEKLNIKIEGNKILLGEKKYGISIVADIPMLGKKEKFKKAEFINGKIILNGNKDKPITKNQIKELIIKLLNGKEFTYNGKSGLINFVLTVSKISN